MPIKTDAPHNLIARTYRASSDNRNYNERPVDVEIDTIVLHYTVFDYEDAYRALTGGNVSAHYLIAEDGTITDLVDDKKRAWHAGKSCWRGKEDVNDYSIGIEIVNAGSGENGAYPIKDEGYDSKQPLIINPFAGAQMQSLVLLLHYLRARHPAISDRNIVGHSDICAYDGRKLDPGCAFDWNFLHQHGHGLYSNLTVETPTILLRPRDASQAVLELQLQLQSLGYKIEANGVFDTNTSYVVRAFNLHYNREIHIANQDWQWDEWDSQAQGRLTYILSQV